MRIRTKVWLLVVGTVVLSAGATLWLLHYRMRQELTEQSARLGQDVANELVLSLQRLSADADDHDLAITVYEFLDRHQRIQHLRLLVDREARPFRIDAPKGAAQP